MESVGWLGLVIIGGLAGWLAGKLMDARYGIILNIVLGIAGSVVAAGLMVALHVSAPGGRLGFFITGFIGACILIFLAKAARR